MKKTALLLIIILLMNTICFAATFSDVKDTKYEQAVETLAGLGIMKGYSDGTFKPEATITRAEFSAMIARMMGFDEESLGTMGTKFSDVPSTHWACGVVNTLVANGAIVGYSETTFGPDDNITLEQALKVIVEVWGYGPLALNQGGYPGGYISVANEMGLLKKTDGAAYSQDVTRGVIANVLYAATDVQIYVKGSFGSSEVTYEKKGTILEEYMGIKTYKGRIIENRFTSLNDTGALPEGQVRIKEKDGTQTILKTGETKAEDFLGFNVVAYAKIDKNDKDEIVYLSKETKSGTELTVKADQIASFESGQLTYYTDAKEKDKEIKVKVLRGADVIYNGVAYPEYTQDDLIIKTGDLTLLDSDNDNVFDLILVNEFKTVVVNKYVETNTLLVDKFSASRNVIFDEEDNLNYNRLYKFDAEMSVSVLNEWDVVAVYESKNTTGMQVKKLYASNDEVTGTVEAISDDEVTINSTVYKLSNEYKKDQKFIGNIALGNPMTLFLDRDGKITGIKTGNTSSYQYAFVVGIETEAFAEMVTMKLFTSQGILDVYEVRSKIELDGKTGANSMELIDALKKAKYGDEKPQADLSQMIKLKINEAGIITAVDTAVANIENKDDQLTTVMKATGQSYRNDSKSFGGKFILTSSSVIFSIPTDLKKTADYKIKSFTDVSNGDYDLEAYDVNEKGEINAVALFGTMKTEMDNEVAYCVLEKITQVATDDGDIVDKYYFMSAKTQSQFEVTNSESTGYYRFLASTAERDNRIAKKEDINAGDICRVAINTEDNTLELIEQLFDIKNRETTCGEVTIEGKLNSDYKHMLRVVRAKPVNVGTTTALMRIENPSTDANNGISTELKEVFWNFEKSKFIYVEEKQPGQFSARVGSINDMLDINAVGEEQASLVIAKSRYAAMQEVFIYKLQTVDAK